MMLIAIVCSVVSVSAKTVEYTYSAETATDDWTATGKTENVAFGENGIIYDVYAGVYSVIYDKEIFEDIEYNVTLENKSAGSANEMIVYFNYQDADNNYSFTIGGAKESNPVTLIKTESGVKTTLAVYPHYSINYNPKPFKIICKNGNINVTSTDNSGTTELFNVDDSTFTSGCIGVGANNARSSFTAISVSGTVNSYIKVTDTTPAENAVNISTDIQPIINFDKELYTDSVNEDSVYVLENDVRLLPDAYSVSCDGSSVNVLIHDIKENSCYKIVVTTDVKTADEETLQSEYILKFETYKGEDYMEYNYSRDRTDDWDADGSSYFITGETGISSNDYGAQFNAILNAYMFRDEFTYSMNTYNSARGTTNAAHIFFNYTDASNYYCVTMGGNSDFNNCPLSLSKCVGGTIAELAGTTAPSGALVEINYKNGKITVSVNGIVKMEAEDDTFTNGFVGVGISKTSGKFENIGIKGFGKNVQLKLTEESNIVNGAENVAVDTDVELVFNRALKYGTAGKDNIRITEGSKEMPADEYDLTVSDDNTRIFISFKNELKEKTVYFIEISEAVISAEYGVGMSESERSISFRTQPPIYDVQSSSVKYFDVENGVYTEVEDISQMGGKDIKFNISVKNNSSKSQSFAISAVVVQPDGEIAGAKYYLANLASGEEFKKDDENTDNTITIPQGIEAGAKMIYFVWDSFTNMITLYPSGEF